MRFLSRRIAGPLTLLRQANLSLLSKAEIACLDEALREYGDMPFSERTELSHDAAWQEAWDTASEDEVGASPMQVQSIAQTLNNSMKSSHLRA